METEALTFNLQELPDGESQRTVHLKQDDLNVDVDVKLISSTVHIHFYKTNHFVEVKFDLTADLKLICDRSLRSFENKVNGVYHIFFEPNPAEESETEKGAVKQIPHHNLKIDISEEVRDTIMLNVPVKKIHPDYFDSDGNLKEFETKHYGPDPEDDQLVDPRWAELKKLK